MASKETLTQGADIAHFIDHTLLAAVTTEKQIQALCHEAATFRFFSVCLPPTYVSFAKTLLKESSTKICTVIGFPLGTHEPEVKAEEARRAIQNGANELDMVINIGAIKNKNLSLVGKDISAVNRVKSDCLLKVILETCYLSNDEIIRACQIAVDAGADFVKTSTGFGTHGATEEHVRLMRETVGPNIGVKASGGIRDLETLQKMIAAGANRIGTSSGVKILSGEKGQGY
ncbi:MAG: deoxyribose-phosphate aldolase [Bdellovibrionales bacterium]|nr:deoxyribose-phosphate aldolase [Bdellovibrionales bacterium]